MSLSASRLGAEYGLTGEEMNRALAKLGFLKGNPGDYDLTSLGHAYATTKDFHRGTGGYAHYNRYWSTRSYDESIKEAINMTSELIAEVKKEVADARAARYAAQAAARAKANADFLAKEAAKKAAELVEAKEAQEALEHVTKLKKAGKIGLLITGIAATGYGIYKLAPYVKSKIHKPKQNQETDDTYCDHHTNNTVTE